MGLPGRVADEAATSGLKKAARAEPGVEDMVAGASVPRSPERGPVYNPDAMIEATDWRLIRSGPFDGAGNMALDEALLRSVSQRKAPPTLRLYSWQPPTLSLGYSQPIEDVDLDRLQARSWGLVRRPTGGRAILHANELTYALVAPLDQPLVAGGVMESYRRLSAGLEGALRDLGFEPDVGDGGLPPRADRTNPICYQVPSAYEIVVAGKKLIGSAQVRRKAGMLQHGSLPLTGEIDRICQVLRFGSAAERAQAAERLRRVAGTVDALLGRSVSWQRAAEAMVSGFSEALGMRFTEGEVTAEEKAQAQSLERAHRKVEWTARL